MITAREIAAVFGKRAQQLADGWLVPCPVPSHGKGRGDRSPSLRISDGESSRLLVYCFAGCDPRDVLAELRARGLLDHQARIRRASRTPVKATSSDHDARLRRQHEKAAWLWSQRQLITGTTAERYLRGTRKIICSLPPTLAFLPPRKPEHHPAMIAAFALPDEIEPGLLGEPRNAEAVHLTLLRADGSGKADVEPNKIIVGSPGGSPIALAPPNDLLGSAICEGIEDGLTAHQATGLGAWAAGSAGRMPALAEVMPDFIDSITIFAHPDKAGRDGAHGLAKRLDQRGIEVLLEGLS